MSEHEDLSERLIDGSALEVVKSLNETKRELFKLIASPDITEEFRDALLNHVIQIDHALIGGVKEIVPLAFYRDIKKKLKKQKKKLRQFEKKIEDLEPEQEKEEARDQEQEND